MINKEQSYLVPVDCYGDIASNEQKMFWFPKSRGTLFVYENMICFKNIFESDNTLEMNFNKIIKIKMISLNPKLNPWNTCIFGSPYFFLFWMPFWNPYMINLTYLDDSSRPRELFFKLKTQKISDETLIILKEKLMQSKN